MRYFGIINYGDRAHITRRKLKEMEQVFSRYGVECVFQLSKSVEHSAMLIEEAVASKADVVLIGGGDGTVNSILNLAMGKPLILGVLPLGTLNALAQSIRMPTDPVKACEAIIKGKPRSVTVGKVNERYFLCFASIGFDAATVHKVSPELKLTLRNYAYGIVGLRQLTQVKYLPQFTATYYPPGEGINGYSLIISNIPLYAGLWTFRNLPFRRKMELYIFKNNRLRDYLKYITGLALTRGNLEKFLPDVTHTCFERLIVTAGKRMYLQIDGEPYSSGDDRYYEFSVLYKAIKLIIPCRKRKK